MWKNYRSNRLSRRGFELRPAAIQPKAQRLGGENLCTDDNDEQ